MNFGGPEAKPPGENGGTAYYGKSTAYCGNPARTVYWSKYTAYYNRENVLRTMEIFRGSGGRSPCEKMILRTAYCREMVLRTAEKVLQQGYCVLWKNTTAYCVKREVRGRSPREKMGTAYCGKRGCGREAPARKKIAPYR